MFFLRLLDSGTISSSYLCLVKVGRPDSNSLSIKISISNCAILISIIYLAHTYKYLLIMSTTYIEVSYYSDNFCLTKRHFGKCKKTNIDGFFLDQRLLHIMKYMIYLGDWNHFSIQYRKTLANFLVCFNFPPDFTDRKNDKSTFFTSSK